uniref:Uncharacterized protein n=1 Tax=Oryza punctata TaxID=4537 RepID=A0A0E0LKU8_ORYPU
MPPLSPSIPLSTAPSATPHIHRASSALSFLPYPSPLWRFASRRRQHSSIQGAVVVEAEQARARGTGRVDDETADADSRAASRSGGVGTTTTSIGAGSGSCGSHVVASLYGAVYEMPFVPVTSDNLAGFSDI